MYSIKNIAELEDKLKRHMKIHFVDFFSSQDYRKPSKLIAYKPTLDLSDIDALYSGRGLYVIMSDYQIEENKCNFIVDDLKAIYRGHGCTVKIRLKSHLLNDHYQTNLPARGVRYDVCMKLDDKNGININTLPYSNYRWAVIVYKMVGSSKMMREQAERAFDEVFGRPLASKEP